MRDAPRIAEPDQGNAQFERHVLNLDDFLGMGQGEGTAKHGKILAEHGHFPPVNGAESRDHPVAQDFPLLHAEVRDAVGHEHVKFFKGSGIQ